MRSIQVKQIVMSKLHTGMWNPIPFWGRFVDHGLVVVTSEPRGNIRVCGFGSGGRYVSLSESSPSN